MCVHAHCSPLNGIPCVLGGFDDGSVTLWDCRQPSAELTSLKLFSETGVRLMLYLVWLVYYNGQKILQ